MLDQADVLRVERNGEHNFKINFFVSKKDSIFVKQLLKQKDI